MRVAVLQVTGGEGDLLVGEVLASVVEHLERVLKPEATRKRIRNTESAVSCREEDKKNRRRNKVREDTTKRGGGVRRGTPRVLSEILKFRSLGLRVQNLLPTDSLREAKKSNGKPEHKPQAYARNGT